MPVQYSYQFRKSKPSFSGQTSIVATMHLDSVVKGISVLSPVIFWLFRGIDNPGNGLHVLQAEFHGHQETEWRAMLDRKGLAIEVSDKQRLRMARGCQVNRSKIGIRISR